MGTAIFHCTRRAASKFSANEPRGRVFRHVNLLVPPKNPDDQMWSNIMEPEDNPPMSGSNSIWVSTVLLDSGILKMTDPETSLELEAAEGLARNCADCRNGKAERITVRVIPSFTCDLERQIDVVGIGSLVFDTAYGGDCFVVVDADKLGTSISRH